MQLKLREYQIDVIHQASKSVQDTLIQIPTGGGKTLIAKEIIKYLTQMNQKTLFVVPKLILMEQTIKVFEELDPQIYHGTTRYKHCKNVFISTVQTASKRKEIKFDVIFIDEIHHGFDGKMINQLKLNNPNSRIIGLSATPYDRSGKLLKGFDLVLNKYDMKYLIQHNYLVPLKSYQLVQMDLSNVKITAGDYNLKELEKVVCEQHLLADVIYTTKDYIVKHKKIIVFAVNIRHAQLLQKGYKDLGFETYCIHSKLSNDEIKINLEHFGEDSSRGKILVSVLMITTGFDMPEVDCGILARPTKSQNLYKQMVGRVLRFHEGKTSATLLDCGNVIKNLGMPLEPIKEKEVKVRNQKYFCPECEVGVLKLTKKADQLVYQCMECDFKLGYESPKGFMCEKCKLYHNDSSRFFLKNKQLYLHCDCAHDTPILEYLGNQKFYLLDDNNEYLPFEEAREYVRNQNIENIRKYKFFNRTFPIYIPKKPNLVYKDCGWINWSDWIGVKSDYDKDYLSYEEAKALLSSLNIESKYEWKCYKNRDEFDKNILPIFPDQYYKDKGWKNWFEFLKKEEIKLIKKPKISFEEARKYARDLKLNDELEWKNYYDKCFPYYDNPMDPKKLYEDMWISWKDWLQLE